MHVLAADIEAPTEALAPPSEAEIEAALSRAGPGVRPAAGAPAHPFHAPQVPAHLGASSDPSDPRAPLATAGAPAPAWKTAVLETLAPFKKAFDESPRNTQLIVLGAMGVIALSLLIGVVLLLTT